MGDLESSEPETTPTDAVQSALDDLRRELTERLEAVERQISTERSARDAALREARVATPEAAGDLEAIAARARALDGASSQGELLEKYVEGAAAYASRAAFFVRQGESLAAWGSVGFDGMEGAIGATEIAADSSPEAARCLEGAGAVAIEEAARAHWLGETVAATASEGILIPFVLGGEVAGALYADRGPDGPWNPDGLRLLTWLAALAVEAGPSRNGSSGAMWRSASAEADTATLAVETPSFVDEIDDLEAEVGEVEPAEVEAEPTEAAEEPAPEAAGEAVEPTDDQVVAPTDEVVAPEVEAVEARDIAEERATTEDRDIEEALPVASEDGPPPAAEDWSTVALPRPDFAGMEPSAAAPAAEEGDESPEVRPPDDLEGPGWAFNAPDTESDNEEARRLARLLVTEIKLYNQDKLEGTAGTGGIQAALREDIDRSRRIFKERLGAERAEAAGDLFHEALVQILADGDESLLGD